MADYAIARETGRNRPWGSSGMRATTGKGNDVQLYFLASFVAVLSAAILAAEASAQTPEQFYAGKTIDFVIGYPPGGSNDTFGRLLARHLGKHIPGKPAIVPKNQPGAGSFLAVNSTDLLACQDVPAGRVHPKAVASQRRPWEAPGEATQAQSAPAAFPMA